MKVTLPIGTSLWGWKISVHLVGLSNPDASLIRIVLCTAHVSKYTQSNSKFHQLSAMPLSKLVLALSTSSLPTLSVSHSRDHATPQFARHILRQCKSISRNLNRTPQEICADVALLRPRRPHLINNKTEHNEDYHRGRSAILRIITAIIIQMVGIIQWQGVRLPGCRDPWRGLDGGVTLTLTCKQRAVLDAWLKSCDGD